MGHRLDGQLPVEGKKTLKHTVKTSWCGKVNEDTRKTWLKLGSLRQLPIKPWLGALMIRNPK